MSRLLVQARRHDARFELNVDFSDDNGTLVLFGASGAGKTSTLHAIAGLLALDGGRIQVDDTVYYDASQGVNLPASQRRLGYVFQNYALFPHLTVLQNIAFGLGSQRDRLEHARQWLTRMRMKDFGERYPHELSGGQQQRVALARALAPRPRLLLLDEPFAALDRVLRERLQAELRQLQHDLSLIVIYVTHSLDDAFAVGDHMAVLHEGHVLQQGPLDDVFQHPANETVAEILGIRNLFRASVVGSQLDWLGLPLHTEITDRDKDEVSLYIQPSEVKIMYPDAPVAEGLRDNLFDAEIITRQRHAAGWSMRVRLSNDQNIEIHHATTAYNELDLTPGQSIRVAMKREALQILRRGDSA
ncbi:MAG: ABC transporter ATP-binding protein [Gemmatimonadetes bacterium]|nr:ABC transporter ATP-binding protein [Gemmatimonadota bacterium]